LTYQAKDGSSCCVTCAMCCFYMATLECMMWCVALFKLFSCCLWSFKRRFSCFSIVGMF